MTVDDELEALRRRVADLERELVDRTARANAATAAAQDRSYWLDRWGIDLNALMRRRGATRLRAMLRALRAVYRAGHELRSCAKGLGARRRSAAATPRERSSG